MPQMRTLSRSLIVLTIVGFAKAEPSQAQSLLDRAKQSATDATNNAAASATDNATGAATNAATSAATGSGTAKPSTSAAPTQAATAPSATASGTPSGASAGTDPEPKIFVNYDFIPGDRVIFAEDFTADAVGDFPRRFELKSGNVEVAERSGQRFIRTTGDATITIPLSEPLPDRFTFEMDYVVAPTWKMGVAFADPNDDPTEVSTSMENAGLDGGGVQSETDLPENAVLPMAHVALMVDGKYAKLYVDGVRVSNVPNAAIGRSKTITITMQGSNETPGLITNVRIAAGGKKLYDALLADGKVSTQGILFSTASDVIRPESKPTLQLIGDMLKQHADLKLLIAGNTDNVGAAAANQTLSEKRAAAVKQYIVANYAIDAGRLTTKGYGSTQPIAPNTTPEGRQTNRRVELVKQS